MDHEDSAVTDVGNEEETHSEPVKVSPADEEESLKDEDVISQPVRSFFLRFSLPVYHW